MAKQIAGQRQTGPRISEEAIKKAKMLALERGKLYGEIVEAALWHYFRCPDAKKDV